MTDEDKKLVFEYMGWCQHKYAASGKLWGTGICIRCKDPLPKERTLDGNDMVAAMNKMVEKGDWKSWFIPRAYQKWEKNCEYYFTTPEQEGYLMFITWLMQPARFFELMAKWLEEQK